MLLLMASGALSGGGGGGGGGGQRAERGGGREKRFPKCLLRAEGLRGDGGRLMYSAKVLANPARETRVLKARVVDPRCERG